MTVQEKRITWEKLGNKNPWIKQAWDPELNAESIKFLDTPEELVDWSEEEAKDKIRRPEATHAAQAGSTFHPAQRLF